MESKWMPSIIVKVDAMTKEFASADGRSKLLKQYIETNEAGEPWMIPADGFDVTTVTPLSLTDIALPDSVKLDKRLTMRSSSEWKLITTSRPAGARTFIACGSTSASCSSS